MHTHPSHGSRDGETWLDPVCDLLCPAKHHFIPTTATESVDWGEAKLPSGSAPPRPHQRWPARVAQQSLPLQGDSWGVLTKSPHPSYCSGGAVSPGLEAPPAPPAAPALGPPQPLAASPQPHSGPAGTPGRVPPAPARSPGSDRVVVGVPQADGVREEAAGEVQRHALHVADGAHPGPAPREAPQRVRAGNGGSRGGAAAGPARCPGPGPQKHRAPRGFIHAETDGCGLQSQYCYCLF